MMIQVHVISVISIRFYHNLAYQYINITLHHYIIYSHNQLPSEAG